MSVAVFDIGKTNIKLTVAEPDGQLIESLTTANVTKAGPPYRFHDLAAIEAWLLDGLAALGRRHDIEAIVPCAHGSGGVLVGPDGPAMPMIDYEQTPPAAVEAAYRQAAGPYRERGSQFMLGAAHLGRQMFWLESQWPAAFADARFFLATPQYWAWRLSGVAAGEITSLAAQSHLWCVADGRLSRMVEERSWQRLMPPLRLAWDCLAPLRPEIAARTGLRADVRIINGIHDSSANLYRYQAAGLRDLSVVSTGTWMVAIGDRPEREPDVERAGHCCNADVEGHPLAGVLTMAGREFSAVAGENAGRTASLAEIEQLIASGTMVLPTFGQDDALFPGSAGRGRIEGPLANAPALRRSLAVLHVALLTDACLDGLDLGETLVLDGSFVREPLYGELLATLRPQARVMVSQEQYGTAAGAALLAAHTSRREPATLAIERPKALALPLLKAYQADWRARAHQRRVS